MEIVNYVKESVKLYFEPSKGFKYFKKHADWKISFLIVYVLSIIAGLINEFLYPTVEGTGMIFILIGIIVGGFIGLAITTFIAYGILHLLFRLFGAKAKFLDTVRFALTIAIFPSLLGLLFSFLPDPGTNFLTATAIIGGLFGIILTIWGFVIGALCYSRLHKLSLGKTVLAMLIPIIFAVIISAIGIFILFLLG